MLASDIYFVLSRRDLGETQILSIRQILLLLTVIAAQAIPATAQSREKALNAWVDSDLIPYVRQQLARHPRFENQTVMFVVLDKNYPASSSNALALTLRDQILEAAVDSPRVSVGWQQGRNAAAMDSVASHCMHDDVRYYIGIELAQELDGQYSVNLRALDLADRTWVAEFTKQWRGSLSTIQRQAMRQHRIDDTFLGARDVPFTLAQTDLLAANIARQLFCTLEQHSDATYIVNIDSATRRAAVLNDTVELIANNLANQKALTLTSDRKKTNAVLTGKAHQIDGTLHQYWLTITPGSTVDNLAALSASAYVVIPDSSAKTTHTAFIRTAASQRVAPTTISVPNAGKDALLSRLRITAPDDSSGCRAPCAILQSDMHADAIVFVLQYTPNLGLVRLTDDACRQRTAAKLVHNGEALRFPISSATSNTHTTHDVLEWELLPSVETYYVLALTNASLARQMANHIDHLPLRCASAQRSGLSGDALRDWLNEFALKAARSSGFIDWRAIQVQT